jgi:hypothetical protein
VQLGRTQFLSATCLRFERRQSIHAMQRLWLQQAMQVMSLSSTAPKTTVQHHRSQAP